MTTITTTLVVPCAACGQTGNDNNPDVTKIGDCPVCGGTGRMSKEIKLTAESRAVFRAYANDADNWSGVPLIGGNVGGSKEERGNLTQLKRAGLIATYRDGGTWLYFTDAGKEFALKEFDIML